MICYAKLAKNKEISSILQAFENAGFSKEHIILDDSNIQKQNGSVYYGIKDQLIKQKESLMIDSLSSLGKNNREIYRELSWIQIHRIPLYILDIPSTLDKSNFRSSETIISEVFAYLAEREISNQKKGQQFGIEKARIQGRQLGRSKINYPSNWDLLYFRWKNNEISSKEFIEQSGLKKGTFYNLLKQYQSSLEESKKNLA